MTGRKWVDFQTTGQQRSDAHIFLLLLLCSCSKSMGRSRKHAGRFPPPPSPRVGACSWLRFINIFIRQYIIPRPNFIKIRCKANIKNSHFMLRNTFYLKLWTNGENHISFPVNSSRSQVRNRLALNTKYQMY